MSTTTKRREVDLGPTVTIGKGKRAKQVPMRVLRGDAVEEYRPDPANPQGGTVKGARAAQGGHDYLMRRGSLDAAQHAAADRYSASWHGMGRSGCAAAGLMGAGRVPPHMQGHPAQAMLACAMDVRIADRTLGNGASSLLRMVIVEGRTLGTVGGAAGEGDQVTLGRVRAALDRLAELWGLE